MSADVGRREFILLPYQRRWFNDRSSTKVAEKGRQEGFTWVTALEAVRVASTRKSDGGKNVWFMSTSQDDARLFIDECAAWVSHLTPAIDASADVDQYDWITDDDPVAILTFRIKFPSGFAIHALPSRPARLRGKRGDLAICDEAAHQDLDAWLKASGALKIWGGRRIILSTHHGQDNAFYRYTREVRESIARGKPMASLHSVFFEQAIAEGLFKRVCRMSHPQIKWTREREEAWVQDLRNEYGAAYDEEMLGIVSGTTNQYISRPLILAAQTLTREECPIIEITGGENPRLWINGDVLEHAGKPWPLPSDAGDAAFASPVERADLLRRWLDVYIAPHLARVSALGVDTHVGIDFGRSANVTTVIIGVNDRTNRRAPRLIIELEKTPWTMQDQVLDYCWPKLPRLRSGSSDCNGNGEASAERAADQTNGKVAATRRLPETAMQRMRSDLESGALALPQHGRDLADDIASLKRDGGKITAKERTTDRKQVRHADGAYALAHFEHSIDTDGQVVPLPKRARPFTLTRRLT